MTGTPWWYRVAWTRCSHPVRSSSKSLYSRTLALASLYFPAFYMAASWWITLRRRRVSLDKRASTA